VLDFSQLGDDDRDATSKKQREAVGKRLKEVRRSSDNAVLQALAGNSSSTAFLSTDLHQQQRCFPASTGSQWRCACCMLITNQCH
jgi:hypothetical protein